MSQSEIHVDTERLQDIVKAIPTFATDLRIGFEEIAIAFGRLGNTWRDDEYDRFKKCLDRLRKTIDATTHELSQRQADLVADVDKLARYSSTKL